jgi:ribonucleoside-diphosphate reductase alpha chain
MSVMVIKRNGDKVPFNVEKIHKIIQWSVDGLDDVSISDIELNAKLSVYDGITTTQIHEILIRSANDLISEEFPNYQYVAARLLLYSLRKEVWGESEPPRLLEHITKLVSIGIYDKLVLEKYTESEIHKIGKFINHKRDETFTYSGLQQLVDKYLIKNRKTGEIYETPQFAFILISMILFSNYPKKTRLEYIKKCYNYISSFKISLSTPVMAGVRTIIRQYSSCVLIEFGDSLDSICSSVGALVKYSARRAGIGCGVGRIRPIGSPIRNGEVIHTGIIPYLKVIESSVKSCSQNGIRGANGTMYIPFWHYEIEDVIVLKNNGGTDENRVRKLDYNIQFSKLFYQRLIENKDITLFSPDECKGLYESFGTDKFDELYVKYENDKTLQFNKKIPARQLAELFSKERVETGRIYLMNIDNANLGPWKETVHMSNLCCEILHPTTPIEDIKDENGEIGVCILSAINVLETKPEEIESVCDIIVRILEEIIDSQDYPVKAAENFTKNRRSLGISITNFAGLLAKKKIGYEDEQAVELMDELAESVQYYCLKSSCELAKEKGSCNKYDKTKYSEGSYSLPIKNKELEKTLKRKPILDWKSLWKSIEENGLRHSTLTCQAPIESSSVIQNATNGIEPVRSLLSIKKSKSGLLKQLVPNYAKCKNNYTLAFDMKSNDGYNKIVAAQQRWIDMAISANAYYNYSHYENGIIPMETLIKDMISMYKLGFRTLYYTNTPDGDSESSCSGGACTL